MWKWYDTNIKIEDIKIERELSTEERKRIDIFIGYKKEFAVIIENKIWAEDGYKQLENYYNHVKSQEYDKIYMIYLTPYEREPSENSLNKELYEKEGSELYGKFKNIKHEEIGRWINDSILENEEFSFLNNNDYKLLKSALIQIINNELSISGENKESKMTEGKIKKILEENIFKDIKTVEDVDEYINMFKKDVIKLLEGKKSEIEAEIERENRKVIIDEFFPPYLKFTKDVIKELEKQGYKKGNFYAPNKDEYIITDDKIIVDSSYFLGLGIVFLQSDCENNSIICRFGIVEDNEDKKNQIIKKKQLKASIENIFGDFKYDENAEWIFVYYINTEKDKPEEIAKAMIDLYELLKKEIK